MIFLFIWHILTPLKLKLKTKEQLIQLSTFEGKPTNHAERFGDSKTFDSNLENLELGCFLFVWILVDTANVWAGRFLNHPSKKGGILKMMQQKIRDEHHQDAELNFCLDVVLPGGAPGEIIATCSRRLVTLNDGLVTESPPKSPEFRFRNYPCLPSGIPSPSFTRNLKMMVSKRNVFQGRIFRFHVKLWEDRFCGGSRRWRFRIFYLSLHCFSILRR